MTLSNLKPKEISIWVLGLLMILIPIQYYCDPSFGISALRVSQAQMFQVAAIALFCVFVLQNIWLCLFTLWSLFLYAYYSFPTPSGSIVLSILGACLIYEASYRIVTRENIHIIFKFMMWFAVANIIYMAMQKGGWELLYMEFNKPGFQNGMVGFMGLKAIMGMLFAIAMPFVACEYPVAAIFLFYPLYISESSCAVAGGIVAYLWQLWYTSRKWFWILVVILGIGGTAYVINDSHAGMFTDRENMWKVVLRDAVKKPLTGWGIDSFRCLTPDKQFMYWKNVRTLETFPIDVRDTIEYEHTGKYDLKKYGNFMRSGDITDPWDNPHNELIMLFYEFGILPLIILGFFIYDMKSRFSSFDDKLIPLTGFFFSILIMSMGQFPFHLARIGLYIPIFLGAYYKLTDNPDV